MRQAEDGRSPRAEDRIDSITRRWYQVIRSSASDSVGSARAREEAEDLGERLVDVVFENGRDPGDVVNDVADRLISLRLPAEALGRLAQILAEELVDDGAAELSESGSVSGSGLIALLTTALFERSETAILRQQEELQHSFLTALRQAEGKLRAMYAAVESSITAFALWSLKGEVFYVNPAFLASWDYDERENVVGRQASSLWVDDPPYDAIIATIEEAGGWIGKLEAIRRDGSHFTVMVAASLVEADDGEPPFVVGSFVDLTYRDKLSAMLWRRVDRLEALQQIDRDILAAERPEAIARAALRHIRKLVPCQRASVTLFPVDEERAEFLAAIPSEDYAIEMETGLQLSGFEGAIESLKEGDVHVIDDWRHLSLPPRTRQRLKRRAAHSLACVPLRCEGELLGALNLAFADPDACSELHVSVAEEIANSLAVAIHNAKLTESIARHRERLRELSARLAEAHEAERRRLARDLHDEIGQKLTALGININVVQVQLGAEASPAVASGLDRSLALVKETAERVRRVIADLRPPMLDDYGLLATLRWCAEQIEESMDAEVVVVQGTELEPRLEPSVEDALVRITQEALTNVLKHAEAREVTVALTEEEGMVRLEIRDNGVGFPPERVDTREHQAWGLITMVERAEAIGGVCRIESEPGEGTRVVVEVKR
jgi:PAS domain S-box-containing protein